MMSHGGVVISLMKSYDVGKARYRLSGKDNFGFSVHQPFDVVSLIVVLFSSRPFLSVPGLQNSSFCLTPAMLYNMLV